MSTEQAKSNKERRQFWQMVIETWQDSGMSVSKFCKAEGLSEGTFYNWRKRLSGRNSQQNKQADSRSSAFIEVAMPKNEHALFILFSPRVFLAYNCLSELCFLESSLLCNRGRGFIAGALLLWVST
ncbi:MAG TPA: transposase [Sedimentisphaerales bacterium]|nr:transposase [Sedimentisphaerales bacterium]